MNTYLKLTMLVAAMALAMIGIAKTSRASWASAVQRASQDRAKPTAPDSAAPSARKIPCKTPQNASMCYWTHGRLAIANGNPSLRLWSIGTHGILGVFNGSSRFPPRTTADDENPELPRELDRAYEVNNRAQLKATGIMWALPPPAFADFEVCPLAPEHNGWMRPVCIECAKNIFIEKDF